MKWPVITGAVLVLLRYVFCVWILLLAVAAVAMAYLLAAPFLLLHYLLIPSKNKL